MKRYTITRGSHRNGTHSWHVHCYRQPWHLILRYKVYHWYDMRIPHKIPRWGQFEKWLISRVGAERRFHGEWIDSATGKPVYDHPMRWRDRLVSWQYNQDTRCYELGEEGRTHSVYISITEDEYVALGGKPMTKT